MNHIRNFSIIAHIDHGKSTLADRIIQRCGGLSDREMEAQVLDSMDIERERGITIKAHPVTMLYKAKNGETYELNLIDTPGHVDFAYEVSRSLAACEGALLLVDAFQGVQAQTVANAYAAIEAGLEILPVVNKIDLPVTRVEEVLEEVEQVIGLDSSDALKVSGKTGLYVKDVLAAIVDRIPAPSGKPENPLQALVFDGKYDSFRGVVTYLRIKEGTVRKGQQIRFMRGGTNHEVLELGQFRPNMTPCDELGPGQVGYMLCGIKELSTVSIGDTVTDRGHPATESLPGYKKPQQMVFCGMYPIDKTDFEKLRDDLKKMSLNDSSFSFLPESSDALGFGFRCGFLGMLHMEIIQQWLEKEAELDLIQTAPNVTYEVVTTDGETQLISNPQDLPGVDRIKEFREPIARVRFIVPTDGIGAILKLCEEIGRAHV